HLVPQQSTHILRGDRSGGGHAPGAGVPGKTEFPRGWTDEAIVAAALSVARSPETVERSRVAGRWEAVGVRAGVRIRVVVANDGFLVTAVPLGGPGVVRNPQ
ncbi:MAG TPA: EndoU domain-containing protein, partial [Pseudonocardia sp.]|nr:EndoU domain-containing protein [Pseudonocardia sp.]